MAPSTSRSEYWQSRLAESEPALHATPSRANWLRRLYVRIYRFLLSQYASDEPLLDNPPESPLQTSSAEFSGKPPKSPGEIQARLKKIHSSVPQDLSAPGPLVNGLPADAWLTVVDGGSPIDPLKARDMLRNRGMETRLRGRGRSQFLQVHCHDRERACGLLQMESAHLQRPAREKRGAMRSFQASPLRRATAVLLPLLVVLIVVPVMSALAVLVASGNLDDALAIGLQYGVLILVTVATPWLYVRCKRGWKW